MNTHTQVAIVGAGPAGLMAAELLSAAGIAAHRVEQGGLDPLVACPGGPEDIRDSLVGDRQTLGFGKPEDENERIKFLLRNGETGFLMEHDRNKALVLLQPDFEGLSLEAAWDDTNLGLRHWDGFERLAVVTDLAWVLANTREFLFIR